MSIYKIQRKDESGEWIYLEHEVYFYPYVHQLHDIIKSQHPEWETRIVYVDSSGIRVVPSIKET